MNTLWLCHVQCTRYWRSAVKIASNVCVTELQASHVLDIVRETSNGTAVYKISFTVIVTHIMNQQSAYFANHMKGDRTRARAAKSYHSLMEYLPQG